LNEFIEVYDIQGRFVSRIQVPSGAKTIETTMQMRMGIYILKWKGYEMKLIVN
jgi:hypothetical protein